jgi:glycolate oxidase iron-sulfur subunit
MALKEGLTSPLFAPAMKLGQLMRRCLPAALKDKVPARATGARTAGPTRRTRARCCCCSAACSRR